MATCLIQIDKFTLSHRVLSDELFGCVEREGDWLSVALVQGDVAVRRASAGSATWLALARIHDTPVLKSLQTTHIGTCTLWHLDLFRA